MLKLLSLTIVVVGFLIALVMVLGYSEPLSYEGTLTENFDDNRDIVWNTLNNIESVPDKKPDVVSVEFLSNERGVVSWREELERGGFRVYKTLEKITPSRLVIELIESSNGVTGIWTYELKKNGTSTEVKISETSKTDNVWIRGINKIRGKDVYLLKEMKYIRVGLFQNLLTKP